MSDSALPYGLKMFYKWPKKKQRNNPYDPIPEQWQFLKVEAVLKRHKDWAYEKTPALRLPQDIVRFALDVLSDIGVSDRERLYAVFLDKHTKPTGVQQVTIGSTTRSDAPPREVFKAAILANASYIIFVHNHPSGASHITPEDKKIMVTLAKVGLIVDIPLIDFIIVAANGNYWSAHEHEELPLQPEKGE